MRSIFIALILFSSAAISENNITGSFESNYLALQKKIQALKEKGEKVNEQTRKDIDALMVQMNHEHAELKRELERKNTQMKENLIDAKDTKDDWMKRFQSAYHEFIDGSQKAWKKLKKDEN